MEIVLVSLIAAVVGPATLAIIQGKLRSAEKREDWRRLDQVAMAAAAAASEAKKAGLDAAAGVEAAKAASEEAQAGRLELKEDIRVVHTLVNSQLMASKQAELAGVNRELVLLKGIEKQPKLVKDAIAIAEARIKVLEMELKERKVQGEIADKQMEANA